MKEGTVDIFDAWLQSRLSNVHTSLPGQIEKYDENKRIARVKPLIKLRTKQGGQLSIPPIDNAPVVFPSAAGFSLTFPLVRGDGCLILFSEEGIGAFMEGRTEVTADNLAKFSLTDAICLPGLWSKKSVPNFKATIEIDSAGNIKLNGEAKRFVTHTELNAALQTFITALNLHVHATAATGPPVPPTVPMSLDISTSKTNTIRTGG